VPHFARKYRVVTVDLAGHGESGTGRDAWTMKAFGDDVAVVVKKLSLDKAILVGHSMGGPVIAQAANLMPERVIGLVGVDTYRRVGGGLSKEQAAQITAPLRVDFRKGTQDFVRGVMFHPESKPELIEEIANDMSLAPPEIAIPAMEDMFTHDLLSSLKAIEVPIRCINADWSPTDIETLKQHFRSFEVKPMSKVGHFNMIEDPVTFNRLLEEIVKELIQLSGGK
jgi:pimeloyl-ACP methyl ester carboxylesterase